MKRGVEGGLKVTGSVVLNQPIESFLDILNHLGQQIMVEKKRDTEFMEMLER